MGGIEYRGRSGVVLRSTVAVLWIVLGPLGQSITSANLLAGVPVLPGQAASGVLCGTNTWGFAQLRVAITAVVTVRAARRRLPFALTWWRPAVGRRCSRVWQTRLPPVGRSRTNCVTVRSAGEPSGADSPGSAKAAPGFGDAFRAKLRPARRSGDEAGHAANPHRGVSTKSSEANRCGSLSISDVSWRFVRCSALVGSPSRRP